jgi:hypothetical protein
MNYKELRDFLNNLSEDQLQQEVKVWPEESSAIKVNRVSITKEDLYYSSYNESWCGPIDCFDEPNRADLILGITKGTIMLEI